MDKIKAALSGRFPLILIVLALGYAPTSFAQVAVRDADSIVVDGVHIRLNGVDAPELGTEAGRSAKRWMVSFLSGKSLKCELNGERSYDRFIGVCYADGADIGAALIAAGHALDCRRYSGGRYAKFEQPSAKSRLRRARYC